MCERDSRRPQPAVVGEQLDRRARDGATAAAGERASFLSPARRAAESVEEIETQKKEKKGKKPREKGGCD